MKVVKMLMYLLPFLIGCGAAGGPAGASSSPGRPGGSSSPIVVEEPPPTCPDEASRRGPFCLLRTPDETDEFNDSLQLVRPDGGAVWSGWGTDVVSVTEEGFVLHQELTGSMGGPIPVERRFVLKDGEFKDEQDLKRSEPGR